MSSTAPSPAPSPVQRRRCSECLRPLGRASSPESTGPEYRNTSHNACHNACICQWVVKVSSPVEVLILQHPLEVHHPKGSARLLHLCLPGSRLVVGEVFDATSAGRDLPGIGRRDVLLYPSQPSQPFLSACEALPLPPLDTLRLVVLDATWRKSRKMIHQSPWLQQLPRMALRETPASNYAIRKAHLPGQLSTFEAVCAALGQLASPERYAPLLKSFDGFVAQQGQFFIKKL